MSYENKEYIMQFFEGVHEEENRAELIEVYQKAKVFDETIEILKELRDFSKQTEPHSQRMEEKRRNYVQFCNEVLREIKLSHEEIIEKYESGEHNAKK